MKKLMMMAVLAVAALTANAQNTLHEIGEITIQPKVGLAIGTLSGDYTYVNENAKLRFGLSVGVEAEYHVNTWLGLSAGANYDQQGWKLDKVTTKLDYLNIPVLANFYVTQGLALKVGVQPGILLNARQGNIEVKSDFESFNFSFPIGISYEYQNFVLDARTNWSVTRVNKHYTNDNKWRSDLVTFTIGYKFSL